MKRETIIEFLDAYAQATQFPITAYDNDTCIFTSTIDSGISMALTSICYMFLKTNKSAYFSNGLIVLIRISNSEGVSVILGPVSLAAAARESYSESLHSLGFYPSKSELEDLTSFFNGMRGISYHRIQKCSDALSIFLNGEAGTSLPMPVSDSSRISSHMTENEEVQWRKYNDWYVTEMKNMIRNGHVEKMKKFFLTETHAPYGKFASDRLRHYKNSMMVHIYIMSCAACEGGLDKDLCNRLTELYSQRCEHAQSTAELSEISRTLRLDFCKRVRGLKKMQTDSMTINKAIHYIHDNRMKKLNAAIIANDLGLSASYLCTEFRKKTGKSMVSYITEEKLTAAKEFLRCSEHSLADISSYLSFSSQCYFQTVFKKYEGMTPAEYRRQYADQEVSLPASYNC